MNFQISFLANILSPRSLADVLWGGTAYAYTNTRVRVRKTKLLSSLDFKKLVKMSLPEIARFLQESEYETEINSLAITHSGVELIEAALNRNLENTYRRIYDFSMKKPKEQITIYLQRWNIWNLKMILRGKAGKAGDDEILSALVFSGGMEKEFLESLVKECRSVNDVIARFKETPYREIPYHRIMVMHKENLSELEDELDKAYYKFALKFAEPELKAFLKEEINMINALNTMRGKKACVKVPMLEDGFAAKPGKVRGKKIQKFADDDYSLAARINVKRKFVEKSIGMIEEFRRNMRPILAYFVAKENEINNLRIIVRGIHSGLAQETIERQLLVV